MERLWQSKAILFNIERLNEVMYDLIITGCNLFYKDAPLKLNMSIAVKDGKIAKIGKDIDVSKAKTVISASEKLVVPTFMDMHMHIDKAFSMNNDQTYSLIAACNNSVERGIEYYDWSEEQIFDSILENSSKVVEMCVKNGTTLLRTNLLFMKEWGTIALEAMMALKKKYKNYCTIQNAVNFPDIYFDELVAATKAGKTDVIGGYPHLMPNYQQETDKCFRLGVEYGLPIDLHCDESDVVNLDCFGYIIKKTKEYAYNNLVTCGHVTGLNATGIPESMVNNYIYEAAENGVNITSLTACNMYLMNMTRRGPTRVPELLESGVNVAVASDNIRDTFRPYGNCDLLEEARLTAQIHKMSTSEKLRTCMELITYNTATIANKKNYGLEVGCDADFNIIDAKTTEEAVLSKSKRLYVIKAGNVIAEKGVIMRGFMS